MGELKFLQMAGLFSFLSFFFLFLMCTSFMIPTVHDVGHNDQMISTLTMQYVSHEYTNIIPPPPVAAKE